MILPGKHLKQERALLGIGRDILDVLEQGQTVSELWERFQLSRNQRGGPISFDWFILSLSFLYAISAIRYDRGVLNRGTSYDLEHR